MKKIFFAMMATAALASCSQDEVMDINQEAIGFGDAFVDNAARAIDPSYSTNKVTEFYVWGQLKGNAGNSVQLYKNAKVYSTKGTEVKGYNEPWWCDQVEYWIPSATYHFGAVANGTVGETLNTNGLPETISYPATGITNDGTSDLIWATPVDVTTNVSAQPTGLTNNLVAFTFNHLLSKLYFEFENGMSENSKYSYKVKDIKIAGVPASGTYTVSTKKWNSTGSTTINFGNATNDDESTDAEIIAYSANQTPVTSNYARMIIPCNQQLTVTFVKELYYDGNLIYTDANNDGTTAPKFTSINFTHEFIANGAYVLKVTMKQENEIKFTVNSVANWADGVDVKVN